MIIELANVYKSFKIKGKTVEACKNINLSVEAGDVFGIVGYSGAGKSTLVRLINALEKPSSGQVLVKGQAINELSGNELRKARKDIAMIFQSFNLLNSKTVYENVAIPLLLNNTPKEQIKQKVKEMLDFVELADKADVYPQNLSGGQKQRVGIARALATDPSILLCDEPTSALDPKTTDSILNLLRKVNRELNVTIILITHQINIVSKICNKLAVMADGEIIEQGTVKDIFARPKMQLTKDFINLVVDDFIPDTIFTKAMQEQGPARIYKIRILNGNVCDSFVPGLREQFALEIKTLSMSVMEMQGSILTSIGILVKGDSKELDKIESYLRAHYEVKEVTA